MNNKERRQIPSLHPLNSENVSILTFTFVSNLREAFQPSFKWRCAESKCPLAQQEAYTRRSSDSFQFSAGIFTGGTPQLCEVTVDLNYYFSVSQKLKIRMRTLVLLVLLEIHGAAAGEYFLFLFGAHFQRFSCNNNNNNMNMKKGILNWLYKHII